MVNLPALFNRFFSATFLGFLILAAGCEATGSGDDKKAAAKKPKDEKPEKQATLIRLHLESNPDSTHYNRVVPVYRAQPVPVGIEAEAFLDSGYINEAALVDVDQMGGFGIAIVFDSQGQFRLDNTTSANKGKRIAILAQWTQERWLGAPVIKKSITDGVLVFTPDATREEAERIVRGINNVAKKMDKQPKKPKKGAKD